MGHEHKGFRVIIYKNVKISCFLYGSFKYLLYSVFFIFVKIISSVKKSTDGIAIHEIQSGDGWTAVFYSDLPFGTLRNSIKFKALLCIYIPFFIAYIKIYTKHIYIQNVCGAGLIASNNILNNGYIEKKKIFF